MVVACSDVFFLKVAAGGYRDQVQMTFYDKYFSLH